MEPDGCFIRNSLPDGPASWHSLDLFKLQALPEPNRLCHNTYILVLQFSKKKNRASICFIGHVQTRHTAIQALVSQLPFDVILKIRSTDFIHTAHHLTYRVEQVPLLIIAESSVLCIFASDSWLRTLQIQTALNLLTSAVATDFP